MAIIFQTEEHVLKGLKLNHRERRFMKFASVEHYGQLYMTPQDFIESVTDSEPRRKSFIYRSFLYFMNNKKQKSLRKIL